MPYGYRGLRPKLHFSPGPHTSHLCHDSVSDLPVPAPEPLGSGIVRRTPDDQIRRPRHGYSGAVEDYEAMVAGPVTGAEGGEQTGRDSPDLQLWPEFAIPAQRADETSGAVTPPGDAERDAAESPITPFTTAIPVSGDPAVSSGPTGGGSGSASADAAPTSAPFTAAVPPSRPPGAGTASTNAPFTAPVSPVGARAELPAAPVPPASVEAEPTTPFVPGQFTRESEAEVPAAFGSVPGAATTPPVAQPEVVPAPPLAEPKVAGRPRRLRSERHSHRSRMRRQTANGIVALACLAICFLMLHRFLPDAGGIGSLLESWLPWIGVPVLVLVIAAGIVHTRTSLIVSCVAALVWAGLYGPTMLPRGNSGPYQLRIFSEDVNGNAKEATASGTMALGQHAEVVALEDMYSSVSESSAVNALNSAYANHVTQYEFGLWSTYPITKVQPIMLGTTQTADSLSVGADDAGLAASASAVPVIGALEATLSTPAGALVVYLVHLPQPVVGDQGFAKARDQALTQFVAQLQDNHSARVAVIGDINVAATDRQFSQLTRADGLTSAQQAVGSGFGFTWPAEFPFVRLDDVLTRGLKPLSSVVLPSIAKGQTHLPIEVDLDYQ